MKSPILANDVEPNDILYKYSNPIKAQQNAIHYLGQDAILYKSNVKTKKYMIYDPNEDTVVHFGALLPAYEDFLKHNDNERRVRYLKRATKIRGKWADNPYSPNSLAINILWLIL